MKTSDGGPLAVSEAGSAKQVPLKNIRIDDVYWNRYTKLVIEKVLPYQWRILNDEVPDAPSSHCLMNFKIAAGDKTGKRGGTVFQDSDAAKWLEAVSYSLEWHPDKDLEEKAESVIDIICRAQEADGYLDTYFQLEHPTEKWQNLLEGHELYCAGHLIEAAVAYYEATGKDKLLKCVCRLSDLITRTFGPNEGQIHACPGHPEVELALVKLFRATGEKRYLDMAKYFIDVRGKKPNCFAQEMKRPGFKHIFNDFAAFVLEYNQSHLPVMEQNTAEGHAVRAVYLYCAMADVAFFTGDKELLERCRILWDNMTERRMYITGGIGSSGFFERFTTDWDLPNDSAYCETCASVGLALFALRMARLTRDAKYIDTMERALYNTVRAGISMTGDRYFYVNPLEVWPASCMDSTSRSHVKAVRQKWFDVACCPTNAARTFASLGQYIYTVDGQCLYINLFISGEADIDINGHKVHIKIDTDYPRTGNVKICTKGDGSSFALCIRHPAFAEDFCVKMNGELVSSLPKENPNTSVLERNPDPSLREDFSPRSNLAHSEIASPCYSRFAMTRQSTSGSSLSRPPLGYGDSSWFTVWREWNDEEVSVSFTMKARFVFANPLVRANCGKLAVLRGPEVYCLEECDNTDDLAAVYVSPESAIEEEWNSLMGGTMVLHFDGKKLVAPQRDASSVLSAPPALEDVHLTAIPYGSWGNRKEGEMIVWMHKE